MRRYRTYDVKTCDKFTTFLDPTPETMLISRVVDRYARNKLHAFKLTTKIVHSLVTYIRDIVGYGKLEYFAGPRRTLLNGYGDCEDFAMTIVAVLRGLEKYRPTVSYLTIGRYVKNDFFVRTGGYHAWAYADGYILEGTAGWVVPKEDSRYIPFIGIDSDRIIIIKPVREDLRFEVDESVQNTVNSALSAVLGAVTAQTVSKLLEKVR